MSRTAQNSTLHDQMVKSVAIKYQSDGHSNVRADHIGHINGAPVNHGGFIPDVTATHGTTGQHIICEVETADTVNTQHTYDQLITFRKVADQMNALLHVGLPYQSDLIEAKAVIGSWGIKVDQWWYQTAK